MGSGWSRLKLALVRAFREAGRVQRCHTAGQQVGYDVARHSFNAASLLLVLQPAASAELIKAVLWHDAPERWLGDVPSPTLHALGAEALGGYTALERELFGALGVPGEGNHELTEHEGWWLRAVDKLELYLWCREQLADGVQAYRGHVQNLDRWFLENTQHLPSLATAFWRAVQQAPLYSRHSDDPREFLALVQKLKEEA